MWAHKLVFLLLTRRRFLNDWFFFFKCSGAPRVLPFSPTRRSSDLNARLGDWEGRFQVVLRAPSLIGNRLAVEQHRPIERRPAGPRLGRRVGAPREPLLHRPAV